MSKLILYLLEASAVLIVLYSLYVLLLRKLTFFSFNRCFLIAIPVFSLAVPLLSFDLSVSTERAINKPVSELKDIRLTYYNALDDWVNAGKGRLSAVSSDQLYVQSSRVKKWWILIFMAYAIGVGVVITRMIGTYAWIYRLKSRNAWEVIDGVSVIKVPHRTTPFSFLNAVFVDEETRNEETFFQILAHEKTHIDQRHSIDLIFVQLTAALLWFNPIVWRLIKSLKTTHEYIVDKHMINQGYSLVEYQTLLLRQLISNNSYGLVHNFNLSFIKKRIVMMKIKKSGLAGVAKATIVFVLAVVISLIIVQCNSKLEEQDGLEMRQMRTGAPGGPVSFPVLSETGNYKAEIDLSNALTLRISGGVLTINGNVYGLEDIPLALKKANLTSSSVMIMEVDKNQKMGLVREIQDVLRRENKRKVLYRGISDQNKPVQLAMLLPPDPNSETGMRLPSITEAYAKEHGLEIMKVSVGENLGLENKEKVYDLVTSYKSSGYKSYVVSVKYDDHDSFNDYFTNLFYVHQGFDQIYDERAQEMFGKSFYDIDRYEEEGRKQYNAVRKDIPRAISVAEKG